MAEYPLGAEAIKSQFKRAGIHPLIERDDDARKIALTIEKVYTNPCPTAILIGREPR